MPDVDNGLALKSPDAGQHLVKQNAGRKDVRPLIGTLASGLFGSGIGRGAVGNAELGDLVAVVALGRFGLLVLEQLGEAEIEYLHLARWR